MIASQVTKNTYVGNGSTTQFPFTFKFNSSSDVKVALYDTTTGVQTILSSDYYVDTEKNVVNYPGYPPGEEPPTAEQPAVLTATTKLIVYRETPQSQEEDLGSRYPVNTIEKMVDKNTMLIQELNEQVNRSVKAPISQDDSVDTQELEELLIQTLSAKDIANTSANNAAKSEKNAAESEDNAETYSAQASKYAAQAEASATGLAKEYMPTTKYNFPDVVAYSDGYAYRCIGNNIIGENPNASLNWVRIDGITDNFWENDSTGNIMPSLNPIYSPQYELDNNGDIMPKKAGN